MVRGTVGPTDLGPDPDAGGRAAARRWVDGYQLGQGDPSGRLASWRRILRLALDPTENVHRCLGVAGVRLTLSPLHATRASL
jgi:hypothetical protein